MSITDLDPAQLQEVKKQLDQVGFGSLVYFSQLFFPPHLALFPYPHLFHLQKAESDSQELDHLTTSYQQLKQAQSKFKSCVTDVNQLGPESKGTRTDLCATNEQD